MCRRRRFRDASGNKPVLDVVRARGRAARRRIAPTATAGRGDLEAVAGTHLDAGFLGADHARRAAFGVQHVTMRHAIGAAENPAGAVARALAGGVGERRLLDLDRETEQSARAAAKRARAAGIRAELMAREEQRKARLGDFQAPELDAAGRMPLARAGPAVASGRSAAARARLKHVPDEAAVGVRIAARSEEHTPELPPRV